MGSNSITTNTCTNPTITFFSASNTYLLRKPKGSQNLFCYLKALSWEYWPRVLISSRSPSTEDYFISCVCYLEVEMICCNKESLCPCDSGFVECHSPFIVLKADIGSSEIMRANREQDWLMEGREMIHSVLH